MRNASLFSLDRRTALITGGARGIGRHVAFGLAEAGAHVFLASRNLDTCQETANAIRAEGGQATALSVDISDPEDCDRLLTDLFRATPRLDVLVNNAGRAWAAPLLDYPLAGWDKVFDLNVRGLFYLSQGVARHMVEQGGGAIIHISSISAFRGNDDTREPVVAYNASKGAVTALTTDMAVKLAPHGIRVNAIAPGAFDTAMMDHLRDDPQALEAFRQRIPQQRIGGAEDIKGAAVFLASEAAAFVTGHTLVVDGGLLAASPFA